MTNTINPVRLNIIRIDIDCKLMPCNGQYAGCLYQVSGYMAHYYGLNGVPLRIFSHADENMGGSGTGNMSSKRVITTTFGATNAALSNAYNNNDG